jgi:hypothetical protein
MEVAGRWAGLDAPRQRAQATRFGADGEIDASGGTSGERNRRRTGRSN